MHHTGQLVESQEENRNSSNQVVETECIRMPGQTDFSEKAKEKLERRRLKDRCDWGTIASDMRILGEEVLGKISGKVKVGEKMWWWGEEVQKHIRDKKEAKKRLFQSPLQKS